MRHIEPEAERRCCEQDVLGRCRGRAHLFDRRDRSGHRLDRDDDDHRRASELRALLVELRGSGLGAVGATPLEVGVREDGPEVVLGLALEHDESPRAQRAVVGRAGRGVEERRELCGGRGGFGQPTRGSAKGDRLERVHRCSKAHRGSWVAARWGGVSGDPLRSPRCGGCDGGTDAEGKAIACKVQECDGDDTVRRRVILISRDEASPTARVARPSPTDKGPRRPIRRPRGRSRAACGRSR